MKIEHTLFALPLAMTGAVLAARGLPDTRVLLLVAVAFTAARSTAMAFNRLVDRHFDAANPRTADREIPSGLVSEGQVWILVIVSASIFFISSWSLNDLCLWLSGPALAIVLTYSYTKRFTVLCHLVLGLCLESRPWPGGLRLPAYVLDSCSVVSRRGALGQRLRCHLCMPGCGFRPTNRPSITSSSTPAPKGPLKVAAAAHTTAFLLFIGTGIAASLTLPFYVLISLTGLLLLWEHRLVHHRMT